MVLQVPYGIAPHVPLTDQFLTVLLFIKIFLKLKQYYIVNMIVLFFNFILTIFSCINSQV